MRYTCIESFCGAGGLGTGLKKAGFSLLWAFDSNAAAVETYRLNVSSKAEVADALKLDIKEAMSKMGLKKGELTLLAGGPPCQGFSKQKRNGEKGDKRNRLIVKYVRLVQAIEPKFFLMENVDMFNKKRGKVYLALLIGGLKENYGIHVREINCADFGVPQSRKRTIIVGVRKDIGSEYVFPSSTHSLNSWVTVGQALRPLMKFEPPSDGSNHEKFPNHSIPKISEANIERISYVPQGSGRKCLPRRLQLPCHKKKTGWPDVYGRMQVNKPASTITGGFDNFTRGKFAHPFKNRPITAREAALLQGFDLYYEFKGTKGDVRSQIGNAVPPIIGELLGKSIIEYLEKNETRNNMLSELVSSTCNK
ncbi:DNA (cytosine-5-)-methyltransferase [Paenibacillus elgii]|uniref:DNA (cytosine-5-)-methyltransferase n=1 Tax=Paenibacillus elgii TaxID=189691 RepID=A0A2T6FS10_9BACL|nr:DNA cytosine methyltransferase [Paenibacillus elgii]PUA34700.1 DNA (cytosine-5-)-methyltransferase [Paenibacillus elgii]